MNNNFVPEVLYEDDEVAVLNKPAGIVVHPTPSKPHEPTLCDFILERWPETRNVGEDPLRPGIVHRLDKETSGILIVAKTQATFLFLKRQFQERKVEKTYLALVRGRMPKREGEITLLIGRGKKFGKFVAKPTSHQAFLRRPREAITRWKAVKGFRSEHGELFTLLEVKPASGRTHQIRVHLAAIGHPIVGDPLYGGKTEKLYRRTLGRMFLHAQAIKLTLPASKALMVEADLPRELDDFLRSLELEKTP